jgi:hypothetical protein
MVAARSVLDLFWQSAGVPGDPYFDDAGWNIGGVAEYL